MICIRTWFTMDTILSFDSCYQSHLVGSCVVVVTFIVLCIFLYISVVSLQAPAVGENLVREASCGENAAPDMLNGLVETLFLNFCLRYESKICPFHFIFQMYICINMCHLRWICVYFAMEYYR